ncbi:hypothetical protein CAPTEDRAFT_209671 [Capitella teleta]|uniref:Uncharacterized protein n=1 Tax=Capitella teleta TaxID=283909 RepID=R7UVY5_CAPTE|nr:hypothetical protein CAPTEDRAFT_209671 [Capitella teleta]|eukprot:ELU10427.1 hypothetical protein CAPTEDRAFT_209671 [Capitella teleta]
MGDGQGKKTITIEKGSKPIHFQRVACSALGCCGIWTLEEDNASGVLPADPIKVYQQKDYVEDVWGGVCYWVQNVVQTLMTNVGPNIAASSLPLLAVLFFVILLHSTQATRITMIDICGVDLKPDLTCKRDIFRIPREIHLICETCGEYWGNIPGLTYCCLCSDRIFGFCLEAVTGYRL